MNRPCEGSAKSGAAFFYAQILFHFSAHKIVRPGAPGGAAAQAGMHPLPPLCGLPLPRQRLPLLGEGREVPALGDAAAQCHGQVGRARN